MSFCIMPVQQQWVDIGVDSRWSENTSVHNTVAPGYLWITLNMVSDVILRPLTFAQTLCTLHMLVMMVMFFSPVTKMTCWQLK